MGIVKATIAMVIWSVAVGYGLHALGVQHYVPGGAMWDQTSTGTALLWSLGTALALLITLMVNVILFSKIAGNDAWKWFKN